MFNPFDRHARTAPSHYPRLPFHGLRTLQLLASLIVGGIMSFFIWHLTHDHWKTPWTFIWLTSASLFSIAALSFTIILHFLTGLNPRLNLALNAFLSLLWGLSWCLLTWYMSGTLSHVCDLEHWNEEAGVMVCRIYKALFTFSLVGLVSTLAALTLDIYVFRSQTQRGTYKLHDLPSTFDTKHQHQAQAVQNPFTDEAQTEYGHGGILDEEEEEAPRPSMGPYRERGEAPLRKGYEIPENQFEYDTGYRGGHLER